eukprot:ctg_2108.g331
MDEESGDDVFVAALPAALWAQCKTGVWAWRRREVRWSRAEEGGRSRAWQGAPDADNALDSEETLRFVEWDAPNTAVATQRLFLQYRLSLGCGSWLLMRQTPLTTVATPPAGSPPDWMIRDGSIRIMLPVDPVLVAIPILEPAVDRAASIGGAACRAGDAKACCGCADVSLLQASGVGVPALQVTRHTQRHARRAPDAPAGRGAARSVRRSGGPSLGHSPDSRRARKRGARQCPCGHRARLRTWRCCRHSPPVHFTRIACKLPVNFHFAAT